MATLENGAQSEKKKIGDLKVVELRAELSRRGLDQKGVKADLANRLSMALLADDDDPEEYLFDVSETGKGVKKSKVEGNESESETADKEENEDDQEQMDTAEPPQETTEHQEDIMELNVPENEKLNDEENNGGSGGAQVASDVTSMDAKDVSEGGQDEAEPPPPDQVEPQCPFTVEDTIQMHAAAHLRTTEASRGELTTCDSVSMIVHTEDETSADGKNGGGSNNGNGPTEMISSQSSLDASEDVSAVVSESKSAENLKISTEDGGSEPPPTATDAPVTKTEEPSSTIGGVESGQKMETEGDGQATEDAPQSVSTEVKSSEATATATDNKDSAAEVGSGDKPAESAKKATKSGGSTSGKSLWISNLSQNTKATDLKSLFSKHGRVTAAKIVTSKGQGGVPSKYFGMVTMSTADEAAKCVTNLHRVDLKGKLIEIERKQQPEKLAQKPSGGSSKSINNPSSDAKTPAKTEEKAETEKKEGETSKSEEKKKDSPKKSDRRSKDDSHRSSSRHESRRDHRDRRDPPRRGGGDDRRRIGPVRRPMLRSTRGARPTPLMNRRIGPPSAHPRRPQAAMRRPPQPLPPPRQSHYELMELERKKTEMERAELLEKMKQKEMEHQNREEQLRLAKERERLKFEREKLEREKLELQQLKMTQQQLTAFSAYSPAAALPTSRGRSYETEAAALAQGGFTMPTETTHSSGRGSSRKSHERRDSDQRTGRRSTDAYHHSSGGDRDRSQSGRGSHRQRESGGSAGLQRNSQGSYRRASEHGGGGASADYRGRDSTGTGYSTGSSGRNHHSRREDMSRRTSSRTADQTREGNLH